MPGAHKAAFFFAVLLGSMPSVAFALADACFEADYAALPTTDCGNNVCQSEVSTYYQYLSDNPLIVEAIDYCDDATPATHELSQSFRDLLWTKFEYAQANPATGTADVPDAAAYTAVPDKWTCCLGHWDNWVQTIGYTKAELHDTYSSKIAHAAWLDIEDKFPWKLTDYTEDELRKTIGIAEIQHAWGPYAATAQFQGLETAINKGGPFDGFYAVDGHVHDPSPLRAYTVASAAIGTVHSPRTALDRIMDVYLSKTTHAGSQCYGDPVYSRSPESILSIDLMFTTANTFAQNQIDNGYTECNPPTTTGYIARRGCQSRAMALTALMRSVNIPSVGSGGFYENGGHNNASFPSLNLQTRHADDVEGADQSLERAPAAFGKHYYEYLTMATIPWSCFARTNLGRTSEPLNELNSYHQSCVRQAHWPKGNSDTQSYCALGWATFRATCDPYFVSCEESFFTEWQASLVANAGCP